MDKPHVWEDYWFKFKSFPSAQRMSRQEPIAVADSYFTGLQKNDGKGINGTGTYLSRIVAEGHDLVVFGVLHVGGKRRTLGIVRDIGGEILIDDVLQAGAISVERNMGPIDASILMTRLAHSKPRTKAERMGFVFFSAGLYTQLWKKMTVKTAT